MLSKAASISGRSVAIVPQLSRRTVLARAKVVKEYREDDDEVIVSKPDAPAAEEKPGVEVNAQGEERKDPMSDEFKKRLREEYVGLGGTPNQAMGSNYFLNIILGVSALVFACYFLGYL